MQWTIYGNSALQVNLSDQRIATISTPDSNWFGGEMLVFRATDPGGLFDEDSAFFSILPVNDPPAISGLPDISFAEDSGAILQLTSYISDVDDEPESLIITSQTLGLQNKTDRDNKIDTSDLNVTIDSLTLTATFFASPDSSGWFSVAFFVEDTSGATDSDTISVTVNPVNDPPVLTQSFSDTGFIKSSGSHVLAADLYTHFYDVDNSFLNFAVSVSGTSVNAAIISGALTISTIGNNTGVNQLIVIADDGLLSVSDTFRVFIRDQNFPPVVSMPLPDFQFNEDSGPQLLFNSLDDYFSDPDGDSLYYSFSFTGSSIRLMLDAGQLTLNTVHDSSGLNRVILTAGDLQYTAADSFDITILPVNDPPQFQDSIPDFNFNEDDTLHFNAVDFHNYIFDPDNASSEWLFSFFGASYVQAVLTGTDLSVFAPSDWFGRDTLFFSVSDGSAADTTQIFSSVKSVNDMPVLDLPDSVLFRSDSSVFLNLWIFVDDIESADSLLSFQFNTTNDSIIYHFIADSGILHLSAEPDFSGSARFYVTVQDDSLAGATDSMLVIINSVTTIAGQQLPFIPVRWRLYPNYPNPFNPFTTIRYDVPVGGRVIISVHDILGRRIVVLTDREYPPGRYQTRWDGKNQSGRSAASGVYFYLLRAESESLIRKMLLLR